MVWATAASPQEAAGVEARLNFAQGFTFSDDTGINGRTNLGFDLSSTTRSQFLTFSLDGALVQDFDDGLSTKIDRPRAALSYGIESRQTALTTNLSYRRSDASGLSADSDELLGILFLDEGTRENIRASAALEFGREAPFGGTFDLGFGSVSYSDTTSPELIDSDTTSAGLNLRFDVDERITMTLGYNWNDRDRETGRDTLTQRLTTGARLAVTPSLNATASIGLTTITETQGMLSTESDGLSYEIGLTQERPSGSLRFSLDSDLSESGRRTTATFGGEFETRRGTLNARFGLSEGTDNSIRPLMFLSYNEDLPRGSVGVSFQQQFATSDLGDETLNSNLRFNWRQELTRTTRLSSNLNFQFTDVLGIDDDNGRVVFDVSYAQDLTEDWAWTSTFTQTYTQGDNRRSTRENEIFIGLETSFGWRP